MTVSKKPPLQALLIVIIPVVALAAAYLLFPGNQQQRDSLLSWLGTTNHGELIEPLESIEGISFDAGDDSSWQAGGNSKWKLVVVDSGVCDSACQRALYLTRQIHKLIPKRTNRLERLYISRNSPAAEQAQRLAEEYPEVIALLDREDHFEQLLDGTSVPGEREGFFYLLDARGNLVFYYTPDHDYKKVIKDLKVLL